MNKVLVIGLDCAEPSLVFDRWKDRLPNFRKMFSHGVYGPLKSTIPPITVPAWSCMLSGKNPGQLGIYGFRNRRNYSYDQLFFANSSSVKEKRVWNILTEVGLKSIVIGVPQTYPPQVINGIMVSSFLTPGKQSPFTHPPEIKRELEDYIIDVENFRTDDKDRLLKDIYRMTENRFKVIKRYLKNREWDFFMFVEMGVDRIHHGFWRFSDPGHRLYQPGHKYEPAILDYYIYLDRQIGEIMELLDPGTSVITVSDHGAQSMVGGFCINDWLIEQGYLILKEKPAEPVPLSYDKIDWSKTKAWSEGGYYARVFMNVRGREPRGVIPGGEYETERDKLAELLKATRDEKGEPLGTVVYKPHEVYGPCKGIPPDLIVYLGNLSWRSQGKVGNSALHIFENDTGPDDANHSQYGMFIGWEAGSDRSADRRDNLEIYDVSSTILSLLKVPIPGDMRGKAISIK
ncbi:MAG: alkaline phosphatase family protein [bacterium]